jgi:PTS system nitrogen regulatory IIA component
MDELSDLLSPDAVFAALSVPNKKALFQQLAAIAGKRVGIDAKLVSERLSERERL